MAEMAVLMSYMPEQLPEEKIRELAKKAVINPSKKRRNLSAGEADRELYHSMPQVKRQVRRRFW